MKHKLLLAALAVSAAGSMWATNPEELRVYINPGHGSWTGNDRPVQTIGHGKYSATNTDTTAFFESNTDLIKGFGMLESLIEMGMPFDRTLNQTGERWEIGAAKDLSQNIVMSRVKNGPFEANNVTTSDNYMLYNRSLPEIAAEVEYNDFDIFVSIHSNAAKEPGMSTNYHLFMYRGKNGKENVLAPGSWEMAEAAAKYSFPNPHASWSATYTYINGDVDFMGGGKGSTSKLGYYGYLGVMKHGVPGYLVEGYFHTYLPATHRGMNFDVDFEEGCYYARGVAEYFGFDREKTGDLYGIVRDKHVKFTHELYKPRPNTNDVYLPLNGVEVTLLKDGAAVATYTTDENYNGAFVFTDLEPGKYTLAFSHPDYKDIEPVEAEVVAGDCAYPIVWLENKEWVADADNATTYPDQLDGNLAYGASDHYVFNKEYVDQKVDVLAGKTIRRSIVRGNTMFILALDADNKATVVLYDLPTKKVVRELATTGMSGRYLDCADIQLTADGILLAIPQTKLHYSNDQIDADDNGQRGTLNIYCWDNAPDELPTGEPKVLFSTQNSSLWYRTMGGKTFSYHGTLADGTMTIANPNYSGDHQLRTLEITVNEGTNGGESEHKTVAPDGAYILDALVGDYRFLASPLSTRDVWVLTEKDGILEFTNNAQDGSTNTPCPAQSSDILPKNLLGASAYKYSGHTYLVIPELDSENGYLGIKVYDVTKGIKDPVLVTTENTDLEKLGEGAKFAGTGAWVHVTRDAETNMITDAYTTLATLRDGSISRFSTKSVQQPDVTAAYAHSLAQAHNDNSTYTLSFTATKAAPKAEIVLIPAAGGEEKVIDLGAIEKGENSYELNQDVIEDNAEYNWAVRIHNDAVPYAAAIFEAPSDLKNSSRGGLAWISDTESKNFGKLVVSHGYAQGIDVYTPELEKVADRVKPEGNLWVATKLNSPFRVGQTGGNAYICDWSDAGAGYWFFNPSEPNTTYDALGGTLDKSSGAHILDGASIGGGSTAIAFQGAGEETKAYSFSEDYPTGNGTYTLVRYDIGTTKTWARKPDMAFGSDITAMMKGQNVEIVALRDGIFVSQARAAGKNVAAEPAFIYMDNDGKVLFNSSTLTDLTSCGSAIAFTEDLATAAISEAKTGIGIWSVKWENNVPSFTKLYMIPGSGGSDEIDQMAFDKAGTLYAFHRSKFGLKAYSIHQDASTNQTNAPAAMRLLSVAGVEDIVVDNIDTNAPATYYNLNGVKVADGNLVPGVYVRISGGKAEKVLVK